MIVRELNDGNVILIRQEDHAALSAQFASHWGNEGFSELDPYQTMVTATTYHDSGFRDIEALPLINLEKGRPYGHRETPFYTWQLAAYIDNIDWVRRHDRYASLIVSMHRTGLWQNRYDTFGPSRTTPRPIKPEVQAVIDKLEASQASERKELGVGNLEFENHLWFNYRMLQLFDMLSLYFCCDGFDADSNLKEERISMVPVRYGAEEEADLRIIPTGPTSVQMTPYPFDVAPLRVLIPGRVMTLQACSSEATCRASYWKSQPVAVSFDIVNGAGSAR